MKEAIFVLIVFFVGIFFGYQIGWDFAKWNIKPDHEIIDTQIGQIMIRNKRLYAIDEVHTLVVDPVLLNQLTAKQGEKKK